jgi:hypothetical protein
VKGRREVATKQPLHGRQPVAVAVVETLAAKQGPGVFVNQGKSVVPLASWAGVVLAVENLGVDSADGGENLDPPPGRKAFDFGSVTHRRPLSPVRRLAGWRRK